MGQPRKKTKKSPKVAKSTKANVKIAPEKSNQDPTPIQEKDERFYLDYIYKNIIESPAVTSREQPVGFRTGVNLYSYQMV